MAHLPNLDVQCPSPHDLTEAAKTEVHRDFRITDLSRYFPIATTAGKAIISQLEQRSGTPLSNAELISLASMMHLGAIAWELQAIEAVLLDDARGSIVSSLDNIAVSLGDVAGSLDDKPR
jgi:hypothetical protein